MNLRDLLGMAVLCLSFMLPIGLSAQKTILLEGSVLNKGNREPVIGASVYVPALKRGTYTAKDGSFRLPLPPGTHELRVTSVGYEKYTAQVTPGTGPLTILLVQADVRGRELTVVAERTAEGIVRRAAERIEEYRKNLSTFQGLLYSKFATRIEGNAFGMLEDQDRLAVLETFSRGYFDREKGHRLEVIQRRQTANIPAESNLLALGNFVSFYDDEIPLLNVTVPSPLNRSTFSRYNFSVKKRTVVGDKDAYIIEVTPATKVLPTFQGTLTILEGTYDLVEVDLRPSPTTAIPFVTSIHALQKFEKMDDDIWQPTYLNVDGNADVEIIRGLADLSISFEIASTYTETRVNGPIPDSVYAEKKIITATAAADSARPEFWENNALSELSQEEKDIYHKVDSLVAAADTTGASGENGPGIFSFRPYGDFNRVGSVSLGGGLTARAGLLSLDLLGYYSFGMKKAGGSTTLNIDPLRTSAVTARISGSVFSLLDETGSDNSIPRIVNSLTTALVHRDYYDYLRRDGWSASGIVRWYPWNQSDDEPSPFQTALSLSGEYEQSRQISLATYVSRSIFVTKEFRPNPTIVEGNFRTTTGTLRWGQPDGVISISSSSPVAFGAKVSGMMGTEVGSGLDFKSAEGSLLLTVPTIPTGYSPMSLRLGLYAGMGDDSLPIQYQYRMPTSLSIIGGFGHFYSAPIGEFGGTEYIALHAEHNFTDIFWRWLGLPTYFGRGVDLKVGASAGKYEQRNLLGYRPTGSLWYTEVGFGLGRIPTFISNVIFLQFDARWGIGPIGSGKFGLVLGISSPF